MASSILYSIKESSIDFISFISLFSICFLISFDNKNKAKGSKIDIRTLSIINKNYKLEKKLLNFVVIVIYMEKNTVLNNLI